MSSRSSFEANYCYSDYIISSAARIREGWGEEKGGGGRRIDDAIESSPWWLEEGQQRVYKFKEGRKEYGVRIKEEREKEKKGEKREGLKEWTERRGEEKTERDGDRERERPNLKEWKHNSEGLGPGRPVPRIRVIDSVMSRTTRVRS